MNHEKVISREYKLVLKTAPFAGDESALLISADTFWKNLTRIFKQENEFRGSLNDISTRRELRFFDTPDLLLDKQYFIFRERKDLEKDEREVTLKFRHADRYISQDRDMTPKKITKGKIKFEEDIKAEFKILYSFSSTQPVKEEQEFKKISHILKLYPGLAASLNDHSPDEKISLVNGIVIKEIVMTGADFILNEEDTVKAECALIIWYNADKATDDPLIVEFSFRYGNKKEAYKSATSLKAYSIFTTIQTELAVWIDKNNPTKTGFIFKGH